MTFFKAVSRVSLISFVAVLSLSACAKKDTHVNNGATFYVDDVKPTFTADDLNSNDVVNRKFINFTACLKDNAMQSAIMNLKFRISAGTVSVTKVTDERGCLVWQELFSYDPYDDEKQIPMTRVITALEGHSGSQNVEMAYNPWSKGNQLVYLKREGARGPEPTVLSYSLGTQVATRSNIKGQPGPLVVVDICTTVVNQNPRRSYISGMSIQFVKREFGRYEINPALSLTIAHQYELKFSSALLRRTLDDGTVPMNINAGRFRVYFALLKEGYEKADAKDFMSYVVSASSTDATAYMGRILTPITMRFTNIAALASRMTGILTIASIDQPDAFAESSFEGPLTPIAGGSQGLDLIPTDILNAHTILDQSNAQRAQAVNQTGVQLFAQHSGYEEMPKDPSLLNTPVPQAPAQAPATGKTGFLTGLWKKGQGVVSAGASAYDQNLCNKYFGSSVPANLKKAYDRCMREPRMILAQVRDLVEKVNDRVPKQIGPPMIETINILSGMDFSESSNFSKGINNSRNYSLSAGGGAELGTSWSPANFAPFKLSGSIGGKFNVAREWFTTTSVSTGRGDSTKISASRGVTVSSEGLKFSIYVSARSCFIMAPSPALEAEMAGATHPQGKYFCADQPKDQMREETYYFVNQSSGLGSSPLSDNMSAEDNPWRMFIRGTRAYNLFTNLFSQKGVVLKLQKMPDQDILKQFNEFYTTQEFPGMLTPW